MSLLLFLSALSFAGESDVHYQQARLHLRRGWHEAADVELRAALDAPGGRESFEICWLASEVAWQVLDASRAAELAEAAAQAATSSTDRDMATQRAAQLRESFGVLVIRAPHSGMASRLQLESTGLVVNPDWKRFINRASLRWRERTPLPARLELPAGSYLINGHAAQVSAGQEVSLSLPMRALGRTGLSALQVTRLEAAAGVRAYIGDEVTHLLPSPALQLAVTQPVGPVLLGVVGRASTTSWLDSSAQPVQGDMAIDLLGRIGYEAALAGALSVRPWLRLGSGQFAPMPDDCDGAVCYLPVPAWTGGTELSIEYREAGRTTAMGTGVSFIAERSWGALPSSNTSWSASSIMMLAHLSLAL